MALYLPVLVFGAGGPVDVRLCERLEGSVDVLLHPWAVVAYRFVECDCLGPFGGLLVAEVDLLDVLADEDDDFNITGCSPFACRTDEQDAGAGDL